MNDRERRERIRIALLLLLLGVAVWFADMAFVGPTMDWLVQKVNPAKQTIAFSETFILYRMFLHHAIVGFCCLALAAFFVHPGKWSMRMLLGVCFSAALAARFATPSMALGMSPEPDGIHYAALAMSIIHGEWTLPLGYHDLPSRFPPGTSLVMCAMQWMAPEKIGGGILAIYFCGIFGVFWMARIVRRSVSAETGIVAALLLCLSPAVAWYTRVPISEVPWIAFILLTFGFLFGANRTLRTGLIGGVLLGLGFLFKPPNLFIVAGMGGMLFLFVLRRLESFRRLVCVGAGILLGMVPWFVYNRYVFGQWITSGYTLYDSNRYAPSVVFGLKYLLGPPVEKGMIGNVPYYGAVFLGLDPRAHRMVWPIPVVALILVALWWSRKTGLFRRLSQDAKILCLGALGTGSFYLFAMFFYYYQETRLVLPVVPMLTIVVAVPLAAWIRAEWSDLQRNLVLGVIAVSLLALGGAIFRVETTGRRVERADTWMRLAAASHNYDVLVTDEDPVVLGRFAIWTPQRKFVPYALEGEDVLAADPIAHRRDHGCYQEPFVGVMPVLDPLVIQGCKVGLWVHAAQRHGDLNERFSAHYVIHAVTNTPLPGFQEIVGIRPEQEENVPVGPVRGAQHKR